MPEAYSWPVPARDGDRAASFPAIEKKHGKPIEYWLNLIKEHPDLKYAEQIALLRERHGFSQAHANAVVLYARGSTSAKRFGSFADYLRSLPQPHRDTVKKIFDVITKAYPDVDVVIAWNQPMVRWGKHYLFGVSAAANHLLIAPWDVDVLTTFAPRLQEYHLNKKTIRIPADWQVDAKLLRDMIAACRKHVGAKEST